MLQNRAKQPVSVFYTSHFNFMVINVSTKLSKVIYPQKKPLHCSADSFIAVADHQPLWREPMPVPVSLHISSYMQNNFPEFSKRPCRTILISSALALFEHV